MNKVPQISEDEVLDVFLAVPEKNLLWAVLDRAVRDALGKTENWKKVNNGNFAKTEARQWIFGAKKEVEKGSLTFIYCCESLDLSPVGVRKYIRELIVRRELNPDVSLKRLALTKDKNVIQTLFQPDNNEWTS
jgi:hypothetical protein